MEKNKPIKLFWDMDGVLAVWNQVEAIEVLYEQGYFLNLPPQIEVVEAARTLIGHPDLRCLQYMRTVCMWKKKKMRG